MFPHRLATALTLVLSGSILAALAACGDPASPTNNQPTPEDEEGPITLGDTIRGVHDTPGDIDEFTFQGEEGDELIGYIHSLAPERRSFGFDSENTNGNTIARCCRSFPPPA